MIIKETIETLALNALSDEYFIVDISVKKGNNIEVVIDGDNGVSIQKCVDVSRAIESKLDREEDDFELSVFSAGLGKSFKVYRQYVKNIGKEVEVTPSEGKPVAGILASVDADGFDLETVTTQKAEGSKKKVEVKTFQRFSFDSKPKVKNIITFK